MNALPELSPDELAAAEHRIPAPKRRRPPLTPGRIVYLLYHYPRQLWRDGWRWHFEASRGRKGLAEAVSRLEPEVEPAGEPVRLHYLTGKRYVPLTSIALVSAQRTFGRPIAPVLVDDGTLDSADHAAFLRLFPRAVVQTADETAARLDARLPASRFPFLRKIRLGYLHLRKLTDVHVGASGSRVVLDSDVFFLHRPEAVLAAADAGRPFFMQDCQSSYGAPVETLTALAGRSVHPTLNVGLYQLDSDKIDWDFAEACARQLIHRHGFSYYLEQALTAVLLARQDAGPLPRDYLVYPTPDQARAGRETAYHYVDRAYLLLYRYGWRQVLALPRVPRP